MKTVLYSTVLAAAILTGVTLAPALASEAKNERAMKTSHIKKIKQNAPAAKSTPADELYTRRRELQMKISM
jgi:hypothetical protein